MKNRTINYAALAQHYYVLLGGTDYDFNDKKSRESAARNFTTQLQRGNYNREKLGDALVAYQKEVEGQILDMVEKYVAI